MTRAGRFALRRSFTMLELMVVVGIIILMTALALPAVSKFLHGQRLHQSGRIMQSAFNEARRAAITQRTKQFLVFFRNTDELGNTRYSAQRYRDRHGWEGEPFHLLPATQFELENTTVTGSTAQASQRLRGLKVPVWDQRPEQDDTILFGTSRRPQQTPGLGWIEFRKDGTINLPNPPLTNQNPPTSGYAANMFDLNVNIEVTESQLDLLVDQVDMSIRESGTNTVNKRCFLDIDPNTGRVRFRVLEGFSGATTG